MKKFHVSFVAVAVGLAVPYEIALVEANVQGQANWYLRSKDGSRQGPYGLSQLGEWSSAGYVSSDTQVQWGPSGTPQSLSSALGAGGSSGDAAGAVPRQSGGGIASAYGSGFGAGEAGQGGDETSEEEQGYYDLRRGSGTRQWSGQGDDSEDEFRGPARSGRGAGGPRDEWGQEVSGSVTAVEGGRWSESVAAAKGTFRKLFSGGSHRRGSTGGRGRSQRGGGRGSRGARDSSGRGRGSSSGRQPYPGYGAGQGGGVHQFYGDRNDPRQWPGEANVWKRDGHGYPSSGSGRDEAGGRAYGGGALSDPGGNSWTSNGQQLPPQQPPASAHPDQRQQRPADTTGGLPPVPEDSAFPPDTPRSGAPAAGSQGQALAGGVESTYPQSPGFDSATCTYSPPPTLAGEHNEDSNNVPSQITPNLDLADGSEDGYPPPPPPPPPVPPPEGGVPTGVGGGNIPAASGMSVTSGGLDPKEIEAFYAAQKEYGDGGGGGSGGVDAAPPTKRGWRRLGRNDISKEDLSALGLKYGEAEKPYGSDVFDRGNVAGSKGRRGRPSSAGKVSVDSMKLKYAVGWEGNQNDGGVFATLKNAAWTPMAGVLSSPGKAITSTTPVAAMTFIAKAGGSLPLLLWWGFSVSRGVLPIVMAFLASSLLARLCDAAEGFYVFSPSSWRQLRLDCLSLVGQQVAAGASLTLATGAVKGWLRPTAKERSAALGRRILAGVCVAGGTDRPSAAELKELCLSPWAYASQVMGVTQALAGVAAAVYGLHFVWPLRGPLALGGFAAAVILVESLFLLFTKGSDSAATKEESSAVEAIAGGIEGSKVVSAEAEARGLKQVLLEKHASLLDAAEDAGRHHTLPAVVVAKGALYWVLMGLAAGYALIAVVEEELSFHFGSSRVVLAMAQVWLAHLSLQGVLNCMAEIKRLRPSTARMHAMTKGLDDTSGNFGGLGVEGGWSNDGPEVSDGLRLDGISVTLPGRTASVLSAVDLHAPAGSVVAVLGGSGAGKTALLQVVLGKLKADLGDAKFQGRPLQEWDPGAYRKRLAWLNQVSARFPLTAGENLGAGDPSEFSNQELWTRAAGLSGANTAIEALPLGYDTILEDTGALTASSAQIDRSGLSEGEWQLVMLSRFLMRADVAKLLVLDEPFNGISPMGASRMMAALGAQARATGQVVIVASQNLSLGRWADTSVFLDNGRVLETGVWDDLLARGGAFAAALVALHAF